MHLESPLARTISSITRSPSFSSSSSSRCTSGSQEVPLRDPKLPPEIPTSHPRSQHPTRDDRQIPPNPIRPRLIWSHLIPPGPTCRYVFRAAICSMPLCVPCRYVFHAAVCSMPLCVPCRCVFHAAMCSMPLCVLCRAHLATTTLAHRRSLLWSATLPSPSPPSGSHSPTAGLWPAQTRLPKKRMRRQRRSPSRR